MPDLPTQGGSYIRDPKTGALIPADSSEPEPTPTTDPETTKKGGK